jgi:hypothetical protein
LLRDAAVVVEGLGSLLLPPAASGGAVSEVLLPAGAVLPSSSLFWDGSVSSDDDDEVLAPQTPLTSAKVVVSTADLHVVKASEEPRSDLFATAAAAPAPGDEEGWV